MLPTTSLPLQYQYARTAQGTPLPQYNQINQFSLSTNQLNPLALQAQLTPVQLQLLQRQAAQTQTTDLMESGGKSSWGNADVHGYVVWHKDYQEAVEATATTPAKSAKTTFQYWIDLRDTGAHGTANGYVRDQKITRARISGNGADAVTSYNDAKTKWTDIAPKVGDTDQTAAVCTLT